MNFYKKLFILIAFLVHSEAYPTIQEISTSDNMTSESFQNDQFKDKLEVFTSFGVLNVKAQEYAFNDNQIISHLIWNTHSVPIVKIGFNYDFLPQLTFGASFWANQHRKNSHMFDYDWLYTENPYHRTNMSSHSNTKLKANGFDLYLKYWLTKPNSSTRFALLMGVKNERYQWVAPYYSYLEYEPSDFYGFTQNNSEPGVSYKQTFRVPYIGFLLGFSQGKWNFDASYKLSRFNTIRTLDNHHARDISFRGYPDKTPLYTSAEFDIGYQYKKPVQLYLNTELNYVPRTKLNLDVGSIDRKEYYGFVKKSHVLKNISKKFSIGIKYQFK